MSAGSAVGVGPGNGTGARTADAGCPEKSAVITIAVPTTARAERWKWGKCQNFLVRVVVSMQPIHCRWAYVKYTKAEGARETAFICVRFR